MTIQANQGRLNFQGDGTTNTWAVPIQAYSASDFSVYLTVGSNPPSLAILNSAFALVPAGTLQPTQWSLIWGPPGTPTALPVGSTISVFINPPQTQLTVYVSGQAFPSAAVQQSLDRGVQISQRLQDQILRSIRAPDGEPAPGMLLLPAAQRANTNLGFDSQGNVASNLVLNSGTLSRSSIGAFLTPQTPLEAAASPPVIPYDTGYAPGVLGRYDSPANIAADATTALKLAASVGQKVTIDGAYNLSSVSLAALGNGIPIKSGSSFTGTAGASLTVTGTSACNVFSTTDVQAIKFENITVTGNGNAGGNITLTTGYFWHHQMSASATADQRNFVVDKCTFSNFGGLYWIYFDNTLATNSTGFAIRDIKIINNTVISAPNNAQTPSLITVTACFVGFSGSDVVTNYASMTDIHVSGNTAYGQYLKQFCIFWSGVSTAECSRNLLKSFGTDATFSNDTGCYALLAYDHAHGTGLNPDSIKFIGNLVLSVRDCGIYLSAVNRVDCLGNTFIAQTSTANTVLPKGAIAIGGASTAAGIVTLTHTIIDSCAFGISAVLASGNLYKINSTTITNVLAGGIGLLIQPTGTSQVGQVYVNGITITSPNATVTACRIDSNATVALGYCSIKNFEFDTQYNGIIQVSVGGTTPAYGLVKISDGEIHNSTNAGINWTACTNAGSRLTLENIEFFGQGQNCQVLNLNGTVGLTVRAITFSDMATGGSGACWLASASQGTVEGVRYRNVAIANRYILGGSDLGIVTPAFTGNLTDFVQDLNTTELGTASSKYMRQGWQWDRTNAAWKESRALTGN